MISGGYGAFVDPSENVNGECAGTKHMECRVSLAQEISDISGFRILSALEVAGDVFARSDVRQQLVEPRRRAL